MSLTAMRQLPRLFQAGEVDSVHALLDRWERVCGPLEPVRRSKTLAAIWTQTFREDDVDSATLDILLAWPLPHQKKQKTPAPTTAQTPTLAVRSPWYAYGRDLHAQQLTYDAFTRWLAMRLSPTVEPRSTAHLLCDHYTGARDLIGQLRGELYSRTRLRKVYIDRALQARQRTHSVWALYAGGTGNWREGDDRTTGPLFGFRYGIQARNSWLRAALEVGGKAIAEPSLPATLQADSLAAWSRTDTDIALEFGRSLVSSWHHTLDLGLGLGYGHRVYHILREPGEPGEPDEPGKSDEPDGTGVVNEMQRIRNGQAFIVLGYGYHFGRWGASALGLELKYSCGRFEEEVRPRWFQDDWSLRLVFTRHRLRLSRE
jgi:hypothetical protein